VHERRPGRVGRTRETAHREGVDGQRLDGTALRAIHVVECGAVDDEIRGNRRNRPGHDARIGHVERLSRLRDHLAIGKCLDDERCELAVCTRDEDAIDRQDQ
jgi:hypothetical protein